MPSVPAAAKANQCTCRQWSATTRMRRRRGEPPRRTGRSRFLTRANFRTSKRRRRWLLRLARPVRRTMKERSSAVSSDLGQHVAWIENDLALGFQRVFPLHHQRQSGTVHRDVRRQGSAESVVRIISSHGTSFGPPSSRNNIALTCSPLFLRGVLRLVRRRMKCSLPPGDCCGSRRQCPG